MSVSSTQSRAWLAAEDALAPLGRRWAHVQGVSHVARRVAFVLGHDTEVLVSAACLHDIGYAPERAVTGFHPLDGARAVVNLGFPEEVAALVAHHSIARVEAQLRGLEHALMAEFPQVDPDLADALCYCDMTTGPNGEPMSVLTRLNEIQHRYGFGHVVTEFIELARPEILAATFRVEAKLAAADIAQPM